MNRMPAPHQDAGRITDIESLLDECGFIRDPQAWSPAIAASLAHLDGLAEMTPEHWLIIDALRTHYARFGAAPPAFTHICARQHLGMHCVARLFRSDREAWRIAGLPDPGEEVRTYL